MCVYIKLIRTVSSLASDVVIFSIEVISCGSWGRVLGLGKLPERTKVCKNTWSRLHKTLFKCDWMKEVSQQEILPWTLFVCLHWRFWYLLSPPSTRSKDYDNWSVLIRKKKKSPQNRLNKLKFTYSLLEVTVNLRINATIHGWQWKKSLYNKRS